MDVIVAKDQSIAAGGDVTVNNFKIVLTGDLDLSLLDFLKLLASKTNIGDSNLAKSLLDHLEGRSAEEKLNNYLMMAKSSAYNSSSTYEMYMAELDGVKENLKTAVAQLQNHAYLNAHQLFQRVLKAPHPEPIKRKIIYDYFVSGYVGYSLISDLEAIRRLINELRAAYLPYFDRELELYVAEAHQEIATRQESDEMLRENETLLVDLLAKYPDDSQCLNLQGLLYRRFGERVTSGAERAAYLDRACSIFERVADRSGDLISIEARNNWAITLIRRFEVGKTISDLDAAESLLANINYDTQSVPLSDFLALPKALNNLGNIYKQRLAHTQDIEWYSPALEQYTRSERFWSESSSPYEWAMIQKNKADVRCEYMKINGFNRLTAQKALAEIDESLKYRTQKRAPYQYERSMAVRRSLQQQLDAAAD